MSLKNKIKRFIREANIPLIGLFSFVFLIIPFIITISVGNSHLYYKLVLPSFAPLKFVFPLVWTVFYILMGFALGMVVQEKCMAYRKEKQKGIVLFIISYVFSLMWYPLFFGTQNFFASMINTLIIIALNIFTIYFFLYISKAAATIMSFYMLWLVFCALLNSGIVVLN